MCLQLVAILSSHPRNNHVRRPPPQKKNLELRNQGAYSNHPANKYQKQNAVLGIVVLGVLGAYHLPAFPVGVRHGGLATGSAKLSKRVPLWRLGQVK